MLLDKKETCCEGDVTGTTVTGTSDTFENVRKAHGFSISADETIGALPCVRSL